MEPEDDVLDISRLKFSGDFDEQVQEVMEHIRLQREEVERFNGLITDLYHVLSPVWKDIQVLAFGSIVTGLGLRTSDVDCYIQLPPWLHPPEKSFVVKAKNILMRHKHLFQHAFAIVHAKVPIVQVFHVPTQVYCDLSFNSPAGVANSNLITYLLNSNKKALHLAILIKYWSKIHHLTGTNLMSSYSLTLLVIFFLQQINVMSPVVDLQENVEENIDEWNSAFSTLDRSIKDDKSMYELLGEFFKYYKTFEFDKYIVSPYLGRPVARELFAKVENVPSTFAQYKTNVGDKKLKPLRLDTAMCIQDPFQHNRNCAMAVHAKLGLTISAQIRRAASIYENDNERIFLKKLLTETPDHSPVGKKKNRPPLNGVRKNYRRNQNLRNVQQNFRQNYHYRGRNQGNWRGNRRNV
ncbi:terminal uridylyltransferase Tailor-like [Maniola hyperantus]|uniref:terminal uridylyltransferase Tailor-like n=1 Tax=Aphantopus hyperantus TaxID=2795564 RepID=UPI001568205E|nr:terminal uridylyltransferase Tailor-like [Maniola hyperantus]